MNEKMNEFTGELFVNSLYWQLLWAYTMMRTKERS